MNQKYDYIFCGTGASASLLLMAMSRNNLLSGAKVLLIDPERKASRDKTFCFWASKDEAICLELETIISKHWEKVELPDNSLLSLSPLRYNHVSSLDLYTEASRIVAELGFEIRVAKVDYIAHDNEGPYAVVGETRIRGNRIFDSRTPSHNINQSRRYHLYQSFVGWMIETESPIGKAEAFRFMDFNIEQQGFTQFVYVLPFSPTVALVELTRFGKEIIREPDAELLLQNYINKEFGAFKVSDIEVGCIPMSTCQIDNEPVPGVTVLGARNYLVKPSTGYAFKNMYYHTAQIALSIKKELEIEAFNASYENVFKGRFAFYDELLLDILQHRPIQGKPIFTTLLKKVEIPLLLNFLDEKTSMEEDFSIFYRLPWKPFLAACVRKVFKSSFLRPFILCLLSLFFLLLGYGSSLQTYLGYTLFFAGLVAVGIPHGAVDHLLESGKWDLRKTPGFIIKYLVQAAGAGLFFYFLPTVALVLFIAYSAWHFGQADGKRWKFSDLLSGLWGASVLLYILGTHPNETHFIVASMGSDSWSFSCPKWSILIWLIPGLRQKNLPVILTVTWLFLSSLLPLLFAFGLYFIGQHSLTSWQHIKQHLKMSHKSIWIHSLPFHCGAWLLLAFVLLFWPSQDLESLWGLFFIFIACISFPHAIAMHGMYQKGAKKQFKTISK